ncbi:MAG: hypothetical protein AB7S26_33150 [Sandaracinaceae bacterium]
MGLGRGVRVALSAGVAVVLGGCAGSLARFTRADVMWEDDDRRPFRPMPDERFAPESWDALDQMLLRPLARGLAFETRGESIDVNAYDEVPDSSWFTNRIGQYTLSPRRVARGPCPADEAPDEAIAWPLRVTSSKDQGATAGAVVEDARGRGYVVKADREGQPELATAADAVGARIYWAAGYYTPCNRVVTLARADLELGDGARVEEGIHHRPMTTADLDDLWSRFTDAGEGRRRALVSRFVEGTPRGPWDYRGIFEPDLNDAVSHEDRRELRGMFLLNAWVNHWDARQHNTLMSWIEGPIEGSGHIRHYLIDFGDCFGFVSGLHRQDIRYGRSGWLDPDHILADTLTFGLLTRPWHDLPRSDAWPMFGYYDVDSFEPEAWRPNYENGAFRWRTANDLAWMARIVAAFRAEHVGAIVEQARFTDAHDARRLTAILLGRRRRILERFLTELSPLAHPRIERGRVCLTDLAVSSGLRRGARRAYAAWRLEDGRTEELRVEVDPQRAEVCFAPPPPRGAYAVVRIASQTAGRAPTHPLDVHLAEVEGRLRVVGLVRRHDGRTAP